jgi:NTP pyrophosphatase (non-canonical NTP hydrolase)
MELNEYQYKAMTTCMESCDNFSYMFLNLVGEVGEFASKVAKSIRKEKREIYANSLHTTFKYAGSADSESDAELMKEAGDILWQLSGLCEVMGWSLEDVAKANLEKLASRKQRGVIDGSGDNR